MTRDDIRREAIERLARAQYGDARSEEMKDATRRLVAPYIDALGDLLPTRMETDHRAVMGERECGQWCSRMAHWVDGSRSHVVVTGVDSVRRYVTDWEIL